jgi:hypothetical protein
VAGFGRKQSDELLIMAFCCGATVETAAQKAGVSARTAFRRRQDPEFRRRMQEQRAEMVQRIAGMLTASGPEAVKALVGLIQSDAAPGVRLGAARAVLELGGELRQGADLEARVLKLEKESSEQKQAKTRFEEPPEASTT